MLVELNDGWTISLMQLLFGKSSLRNHFILVSIQNKPEEILRQSVSVDNVSLDLILFLRMMTITSAV